MISIHQIKGLPATMNNLDARVTAIEDSSSSSGTTQVTIPNTGWVASTLTEYPYMYTLSQTGITTSMKPSLTISPESLTVAENCGFAPFCETGTDELIVYAVSVPEASIQGTLSLMTPDTAGSMTENTNDTIGA